MKDAYYFPHFSNARLDRKIRRLLKDHSHEGYAIYFMLLEVLREQGEFKYPIQDIDLLADEFKTTVDKVSSVLHDYQLFKIDDDEFYSPKLIEFMQPYLRMKQQRKEAGLKSAESRKLKAEKKEVMLEEIAIEKKEIIDQVIEYLNTRANKKYSTTARETVRSISARISEGYKLEDFKRVVDNKLLEWRGTEYEKYIQPSTLFGNKFDNYLNQGDSIKNVVDRYKTIDLKEG